MGNCNEVNLYWNSEYKKQLYNSDIPGLKSACKDIIKSLNDEYENFIIKTFDIELFHLIQAKLEILIDLEKRVNSIGMTKFPYEKIENQDEMNNLSNFVFSEYNELWKIKEKLSLFPSVKEITK